MSSCLSASVVRQNTPLPAADRGFHREAKAAEQKEEYAEAETLYRRALEVPDERESAVKDLAGLLNQMGRTREAIEFLEAHPPGLPAYESAYNNLLNQLRTAEVNLERNRDLPRTLLLEVFADEVVDEKSLPKLISNAMAVRELDHFNGVSGRRAIISFASNSAARRALRSLQHPQSAKTLRAAWAPAGTQFAMYPHEMFRSDADWEDCFTNVVADPARFIPPENFTDFPTFE